MSDIVKIAMELGAYGVLLALAAYLLYHYIKTNKSNDVSNDAIKELKSDLKDFINASNTRFSSLEKAILDMKLAKLAKSIGKITTEEQFTEVQNVFDIVKRRERTSIPPMYIHNRNSKFRGRMLSPNDVMTMFAGNITDCCQRFGDCGMGAMLLGTIEENAGIFVVEELQEDGNYHLTYTFRNIANNPVYEKTITPSELIRVEQYIEGTQTGYVPVGTTQCVIPDTDQSEADAEPLSSQSYWLNGVKALMREKYPDHSDLAVIQTYEMFQFGALKYTMRIRESVIYSSELMGLRKLPKGVTMAASAVDIASDWGLPLPAAVTIIATVIGTYDDLYELQQAYTVVAYRGVVQYERIGTAQNVGENEQYYNVVSTKSIVEYLGAEKVTVNSNLQAMQKMFFTGTIDEIYTPSEYEFNPIVMREKIIDLHT